MRKPDEIYEALALRCWKRKVVEVSPANTPAGVSRPQCRNGGTRTEPGSRIEWRRQDLELWKVKASRALCGEILEGREVQREQGSGRDRDLSGGL